MIAAHRAIYVRLDCGGVKEEMKDFGFNFSTAASAPGFPITKTIFRNTGAEGHAFENLVPLRRRSLKSMKVIAASKLKPDDGINGSLCLSANRQSGFSEEPYFAQHTHVGFFDLPEL